MRPQALAEIEGIARHPGFATRSGEPSEALEEIVKIFDQEKAVIEAERTKPRCECGCGGADDGCLEQA